MIYYNVKDLDSIKKISHQLSKNLVVSLRHRKKKNLFRKEKCTHFVGQISVDIIIVFIFSFALTISLDFFFFFGNQSLGSFISTKTKKSEPSTRVERWS